MMEENELWFWLLSLERLGPVYRTALPSDSSYSACGG